MQRIIRFPVLLFAWLILFLVPLRESLSASLQVEISEAPVASAPSDDDSSSNANEDKQTDLPENFDADSKSAFDDSAESNSVLADMNPASAEHDETVSNSDNGNLEGKSEDSKAIEGQVTKLDSSEASSDQVDGSRSWLDFRAYLLIGVVLSILAIASIVGQYLSRQPSEGVNPALIRRFRQRINAWWFMCAILAFGVLLRATGTIVLCTAVSFWALREFITMAPTRRGDHRGLFWALIIFTPLQYLLIGLERVGLTWQSGEPIDFYGLYSIVIPVYASLYIPARLAMSGDHKKFLERSAQITFGLLICVYSLSYAAALVNLDLKTSTGEVWNGSPAGLLFFFILVSQVSDILQWTWGYLIGKRVIAPEISASRTWEGLAGGTLSAGLVGATLYWVTPFTFVQAACMSMVIGVMGFFGGISMSAIKRDRGVNDYGTLVQGHAGVLDRIDTLCFAAPVFYHLTRLMFT